MFNLLAAGTGVIVAIAVILFLIFLYCVTCIKIVSRTNAYVVERLGKYQKTWRTGIHFLVPFIDRIAVDNNAVSMPGRFDSPRAIGIVNLKEQVVDFDPQPVITKDNVTMQIDTVVYYQITDPKAYVYGVSNPIRALDNLTTTTIRNIMGSLQLDDALTSRDTVNEQMRDILDKATDPWGIKVFRVEIKNIMPPKDIRDAMEKEMRAERERRQAVLLSEGKKRSAILEAEGIKEAEILRAEAKKEALIREAEGNAKAILVVNEATAQGLEMIKKVGVDEGVLTLKAYEALAEMSKGQATKIIVPSNIQAMAGLATSLKEIITDEKK